MPTYQYECTSCGHQFEQIQSFSDEPIKNCPECNSEVKKIYSAVGVVFKGSGFYKTDSAPKSSD
jgi:putative FmdB family regulatory protein